MPQRTLLAGLLGPTQLMHKRARRTQEIERRGAEAIDAVSYPAEASSA
jgi:hypothetical protein